MENSGSFYDRYQAGEHRAVWSELIAAGAGVREGPLHAEAMAVCEEIVRRARLNLRQLRQRLLGLGYEFDDPDAALREAGSNATEGIARFESDFGTIPLIARVWYATFDSVDFRQADRQRAYLQPDRPPASPDFFGLGSHPVLLFQSLDRSRDQFRQMVAQHQRNGEEARKYGKTWYPEILESQLLLGSWASNCEPVGLSLPGSGVDGVVLNDGVGDVYFVDLLRSAFRFGGFPFWQWSLGKPKFYSPMEYRPNFEKLLPLLTEGLLHL